MMTLIMAAKETNINSAFLYSSKWPAPGTDAFFTSRVSAHERFHCSAINL